MTTESLSIPDAIQNGAIQRALARTPARVLAGRSGSAYRTSTWLKLREDHAAARDSVHDEVNLIEAFGPERIERYGLFTVRTQAETKTQYLMRPDLGRQFETASQTRIRERCSLGADLQVVIGDGLSATAVISQALPLLDQLALSANQQGWTFGTPFFVRLCRVGVMNHVGALLDPAVVVLLIGERPGLMTAESLSAYLAYRPRPGHTDAHRNLISNIHSRGIGSEEAARRILALAQQMCQLGRSGVDIKEDARMLEPANASR